MMYTTIRSMIYANNIDIRRSYVMRDTINIMSVTLVK